MSVHSFELVAAVALVLVLSLRRHGRAFLGDYALLALAGFIGEQTSITMYRYYRYDPEWSLFVLDVPVLVPLIWPLVILSARDVRDALLPGARGSLRTVSLFALVTMDASLMEVIATHAGMWTWAEPGHLEVPLLGIVAWSLFACAADGLLDRLTGLERVLVIPASVLIAHACIASAWWLGFKWFGREDLGVASVGVVALLGVVATALAWRHPRKLPLEVTVPRLVAAGAFVVLFVFTASRSWPHWVHLLAVAGPYWAATDLRAFRARKA